MVEGGIAEPDRDLPALTLVPHRDLPLDGDVGVRSLPDERHCLVGEFGEYSVGPVDVEVDGGCVEAPDRLVGERCPEKADGRTDACVGRNDQLIEPEFVEQAPGVERPTATDAIIE